MAKPFRLQPLVDLAEQRSQSAARILAMLKHQWQEAQSKQQQLQDYLEEYRSRLHRQTQSGLSVLQWRDYQAFMSKLELAIEAQGHEIERCRLSWENGQVAWQACEREVKVYATLRERHVEVERKIDARQDQRVQDEFSSSQHHRKNTSQE
ncbi:flagellar FliJ protein [mine drainage metagenome]|uniref:Flagellar FliJ protein n=1 Tax=mine drainage metagenome TaxID=410659 RepID=A0A1J5QWA9_9ZZZZ